jgi:hypothetical protein
MLSLFGKLRRGGTFRGEGVQVQADNKLVSLRDRSEGLHESALAVSEAVGYRLRKVGLLGAFVNPWPARCWSS